MSSCFPRPESHSEASTVGVPQSVPHGSGVQPGRRDQHDEHSRTLHAFTSAQRVRPGRLREDSSAVDGVGQAYSEPIPGLAEPSNSLLQEPDPGSFPPGEVFGSSGCEGANMIRSNRAVPGGSRTSAAVGRWQP